MATAVVRYTAAAVSDRGHKRPSNEDAYGFSVEAGVYVVCDGMGGAAAGEIASTIAVDEILRLLTHRSPESNAARRCLMRLRMRSALRMKPFFRARNVITA